jgi:hypothetical protein
MRDWHSLYQCRPRPPEGAMRAWDLASSVTGDWTVGLRLEVVKEGKHSVGWVISDVRRMRGRPDEVRRLVLAVAESDGGRGEGIAARRPGTGGLGSSVPDVEFALQHEVRTLSGFTCRRASRCPWMPSGHGWRYLKCDMSIASASCVSTTCSRVTTS